MTKNILITGSTDGIGLETACRLADAGHRILLHGRTASRLEAAIKIVSNRSGGAGVEGYLADLSVLPEVDAMAARLLEQHNRLDVLINNAGVFATDTPLTADGLDLRFVVNAVAPYLLTRRLLPLMCRDGRVINLSSAAQAPVDVRRFSESGQMTDMAAYAQSKLALTMWSRQLALSVGEAGPVIVAVNPGSLLDTKMVRQAFGMAGHDVGVGAAILVRAALSNEFVSASGKYFDNDLGRFGAPHPDALDEEKSSAVIKAMIRQLRTRVDLD